MANSNSFNFSFFLRRKSSRTNKFPIYARITVHGSAVEFVTKVEIEDSNWDKAHGRALQKTDEGKRINHVLDSIKGKILTDYNSHLFNNRTVNAEILKNDFLGIVDESNRIKLLDLFDMHNLEMKNILAWGTLKNYFTTKKYFQAYIQKVMKRKDVELSELSYKFISGFESFMRSEYTSIDPSRPCENNTIMKHIERFRKIINLAIKNEWIDKDPFLQFKPKFTHVEREFLTNEELTRIEQRHFSLQRLQMVQDLFVFSCYTGLAYIDVFNLDASNLTIGINGKYWITTSRQKTGKPVKIPLLPKAQAIIDKYKKDPTVQKQNKLLPTYTNQRVNAYLKEIADLCEITKPLTFHIARHTFATTVTLTNGVPIETVSKLLGHSSMRATQIYAKVVESKVMNDMDVLSKRLEENESLQIRKAK
jgi:integrase/recombinase XerD